MEYKKITKSQTKTVKHLLNSASTDDARPILECIHVNVEDDYICSANGFVGTFIQYKGSELESIFPTTGTFLVKLGRIGKDNLVEITPYAYDDRTYPNLSTIAHAKSLEPANIFGISKYFLSSLLKQADNLVIVKVWDSKQIIELQYNVQGVPAYSLLMPMHIATEGERITLWHPKEYIPEGKLI
jgi:hypothetical protein